MLKKLHVFAFFMFSILFITDAFAAGYSCPTYKRYTSCNSGYYMTSNFSSSTCNTTPVAGNACRPCSVMGSSYICDGGTTCPKAPITCSAGYYLPANSSTCTRCTANYYCPGGNFAQSSSIQGRYSCPKGYPTSSAGNSRINNCYYNIIKGAYILKATATGDTIFSIAPCQEGFYCPGKTIYYGTTGNNIGSESCPTAYPESLSGSDAKSDCYYNLYAGGYAAAIPPDGDGVIGLSACPANHYCAATKLYFGDGRTGLESCPSSYPYSNEGATSINKCYISVSGGYAMPSTGNVEICPGGTYKVAHTLYYPNTSTCSTCSNGFVDGEEGTSSPNDCKKLVPAGSYMGANYTIKLCSSGTYSEDTYVTPVMPASGCTDCPEDTPFSPEGAEGAGACGRLLHLGDSTIYLRSGKKTTPSLNVLIDGTTFYGNLSTSISSPFKIKSGSTTYSLYDDTMD